MTESLGVVVSGGAAEQADRLVMRLVAEGIGRVAVVGRPGGRGPDAADALHAAIDRLRRAGRLPDAVVLLDGSIDCGPGFVAGLSGALASDDRLVVVTGNQDRRRTGGVVLVEDGVASGGCAVRGSWFEGGYRFPRGCSSWFGLDDLVFAVRAAGGLVGVATDLPMQVADPMEGAPPGEFELVNAWGAERNAFWARRGEDVAAAVDAAAVRALGRPVPRTPSVPMEVINLARRPDRLQAFHQAMVDRAGPEVARLVARRDAVDALDLVPSAELESIIVVPNRFGSRRAVIACALSHLSVWTDAADSRQPATLVLEDDSEPVPGFVAALELLLHRASDWPGGWDVVLLDYFPEAHDRSDLWSTSLQRVQPMRWERYRGGLYGYLVSDRGAERLLELVARYGLDREIDLFVRDHGSQLTTLEVRPPIVSPPFPMVASAADSDIEHDEVALF